MTRNGRLGNILAVLENPTDEVPCAITRGLNFIYMKWLENGRLGNWFKSYFEIKTGEYLKSDLKFRFEIRFLNLQDTFDHEVVSGKIVYEYLKSELPPENFVAQELSKEAQHYNGFNVILLHRYAKKCVWWQLRRQAFRKQWTTYLKFLL